MSTPNVENYTLGRGSLYWAEFNAETGLYEGERHLGNAPEVTLAANVTRLDHYSSMSGLKAKDKSAVSQISPQISFTLEEFDGDNWMMLVYGTSETVSQAASDEVSFTINTPEKGRYYELGKLSVQTKRLPHGTVTGGPFQAGETITGGTSSATGKVLAVQATYLLVAVLSGTFGATETITGGTSNATATTTSAPVAVSGLVVAKSGSTVHAATTDYVVDAKLGRVFITEDSGITASVTFTFGCAAVTYTRIKGLTSLSRTGRLRFISDNPEGGNYELVAWKCQPAPNGDTGLISDDWGNMKFQADVLKDSSNPDSPYLDLKIY